MNARALHAARRHSPPRKMAGPAALSWGNRRERGTALIMSLVILMILTILGISAMGTATLEEKMSGNIQEGTRGFEVAESGLQKALLDGAQYAVSTTPITTIYSAINNRKPQVTTTYLQEGSPPRGFGFSTDQKAYHFSQQSKVNAQVDSVNIGLNTTVTRGVVQIK
ncbi:MAG: PilX N-terminal domain-containing pilus assembly protein [Sulfuricaulis sp.]|uniref:pilus assembly PilX family protein n=1 Tax=Sulfuricaulis sp. TaxID=2003553 RepID=UPI0025FA6E1A|nr:PilX N-terminal domain-containing pilus assembly protein [Sulfuricaulis sp.]MCR4346806.1 PilX N-terminal domain-containing pilus assembly protein [Sulfuricaulis sp.]